MADLNEIQSSKLGSDGLRYTEKRIDIEDIKKLEALAPKPAIPTSDDIDNYIEAITIEYYLTSEVRFISKTLYFYIPLIDPEVLAKHKLLEEHISQNHFFNLIEIIDKHPELKKEIMESYGIYIHLYKKLSLLMKEENEKNSQNLLQAFYLCEILMSYEPRISSLNVLGNFMEWNLNYLIRQLNTHKISFSASDTSVTYFIKKNKEQHHNQKGANKKEEIAKESFHILSTLFFAQAFPGRNLAELQKYYY